MNLSIIGNPEGVGRKSKEQRDAKKAPKKEKRKGKPNRVKKVLLSIPRNAFLGLIRLNFRGLATRLQNQIKINPEKVKAMWLRLGGTPARLFEPVEKGAKKKRLLGIFGPGAIDYEYTINGVSEPATAASLLLTAAPIIAVVAKFLKGAGEKEGPGEYLDDIQPAPGDEITSDTAAEDAETNEAKQMQPTEGGTPKSATIPRSNLNFDFSPTTGLILAGVLVGGYLLIKKK